MSKVPLWKQHERELEALAKAEVNFDLERRSEYTEETGWHLDEYEATLPPEPPGPPVPGGSFEIGKQVMLDYRFPDPRIITGIYYPDRPLAERVMLLQAKFLTFTFYFGVRIGGVTDERRQTDDGEAQVWGFNYQTLKGHFEKGQMDFEMWKYLDSGQVFFRIHAFSQPDVIPNPLYRVGFKLFGRRLQRYFAHQSLKRMQRFVLEGLAERRTGLPTPERDEGPTIQPASATSKSEEKMESVQAQSKEDTDRAPADQI